MRLVGATDGLLVLLLASGCGTVSRDASPAFGGRAGVASGAAGTAPAGGRGGSSGSGGAVGDGGHAGEGSTTKPAWVLSASIGPCDLYALTNPGALAPVFRFEPCDGVSDCEASPFLLGELADGVSDYSYMGHNTGWGAGASTRFGLAFSNASGAPPFAIVVGPEGQVLAGVRSVARDGVSYCYLPGLTLRGERFASLGGGRTEGKPATDVMFSLFGEIGATTLRVRPFTLSVDTVSQGRVLGAKRLAAEMAFANGHFSIGVEDQELIEYAPRKAPPVVYRGWPVVAGDAFLYPQMDWVDKHLQYRLMSTDGVEAPKILLDSEPGTGLWSVFFADSHVAFVKGLEPSKTEWLAKSTELWAAAWPPVDGVLAPYKVGEIENTVHMGPDGVGGLGRCAAVIDGDAAHTYFRVWNLATKAARTWDFLNRDIGRDLHIDDERYWGILTRPGGHGLEKVVRLRHGL